MHYAAETAVDREIPNPAVKAATVELKRLRTSAQKLRAALGRTLVLTMAQPMEHTEHPAEAEQPSVEPAERPADTTDQPAKMAEDKNRPPTKFKRSPRLPQATRAALMVQLQTIEVQIEQTRVRLRSLPARVLLSTQGPLPLAPQLEAKLIADAVKVAAYNAQSWLADRVARHYPNANDLHDLLRSFAHLSGTMTRQPEGGLRIDLEPPDTPLSRRTLAGLCADLNQLRPVLPGTDIPVQYAVAEPQPTAKRRHAGSQA